MSAPANKFTSMMGAGQRLALAVLVLLAASFTVLRSHWSVAPLPVYEGAARGLRAQIALLEQSMERPTFESFTFDPNTVTETELIRLGLSPKQAASWGKFRGGRSRAFRAPEDIRKLYVLSPATKERLVALARVTDTPDSGRKPPPARFTFDANEINATELERLGLSRRTARAYVNYRARIEGGFTYANQLRRLPFLDSTLQNKLASLATFPAPAPLRPKHLFPFNPNTISADSLELLGFPPYQARSLLKYRGTRLNTFRQPADLHRVRSLDSHLVNQLLPYFQLPEPSPQLDTRTPRSPPPPLHSIDINQADTTLLKTLPGIGSYRASRIARYREALGGFYRLEQVAQTRGLPDSTYQQILPYLRPGPLLRTIPINLADANELKRHPNINRNLANAIIRYRQKHGPFTNAEDLRRIRLLTEDKLPAILPYLSFEN